MTSRIGFMQGRLSPMVDGRIQAFPRDHWRAELAAAEQLGLRVMEWTLDHEGLASNPLMTEDGRAEIRALGARHGVRVPSVTGDCFMQAPFWKAAGGERAALLDELDAVIRAAGAAGVEWIVVPLVDDGRLASPAEEDDVVRTLCGRDALLREAGTGIVFESDFAPGELRRLITRFPADRFGVNHDIGNSAALGHDPQEELEAYGGRIRNVHVKDRLRGGTTVPLGTGAADLPLALRLLAEGGYEGRYILQTARAQDGDHAGALRRYRDMVAEHLAAGRAT